MDEETRAALRVIAREWDKAERLMKLAEKIRAEVVAPSINELRYAGRRLVDALNIADDIATDQAKRSEFDRFVGDCLFRVHCAQHDAIDASFRFIQRSLDEYADEFGLPLLMTHFPAVADLRASMTEADDVIVSSREFRGMRAQEYDSLAVGQLPVVITIYRTIASNRQVLEALVGAKLAQEAIETAREQTTGRRHTINNGVILLSAIVGAVIVVFLTLLVDGRIHL